MKSRGNDPNNVTYGIMLMGYAKADHLKGIGEAVALLDDEELLKGPLIQSLSRVHYQEALERLLEKTEREKQRQQQAKAEAANAEETQSWKRGSLLSNLSSTLTPFSITHITQRRVARGK